MFPIPDGDQGKRGGKGEEEEERGEERTDMLPATVMSRRVLATVLSCTLLPLILTRRASYFYTLRRLCVALSCRYTSRTWLLAR